MKYYQGVEPGKTAKAVTAANESEGITNNKVKMESQNQTPITDAAMQQLDLRKQFISQYSNKMTVFFTEKVKTAFDAAAQELEAKHKELMQQSQEMLQSTNSITIKTDEPTDKQTGYNQNGTE